MTDPRIEEGLKQLQIDETQLTQQDLEFEAYVQRTGLTNLAIGATTGFAIPYAIIKRTGGSRLGGGTRGLMLASSTLAGILGSLVVTSWQVTKRIDHLDNNSYIKKLANQVLVGRYPMAVADTMQERQAKQAPPK